MSCFIDTSAFVAVLDSQDAHYKKAAKQWKLLVESDNPLICSNYILLETFALIQNRLGLEALRTFQEDVLPVLTIEWVDEAVHQAAAASVLTAGRKRLSLVDCASFIIIRRLGISNVFTFDKHFLEQGFHCVP